MHVMEPHHILKVKNAVVKSVYYFMEYTICKLFVGWGREPISTSKMRQQVPSEH